VEICSWHWDTARSLIIKKHPNVDYRIDQDGSCIRYYSSSYRAIAKGDELCISYGSNLWFDDASDDGEDAACGLCGGSDVDTALGSLTRIHLQEDDNEKDEAE
jgi:SET domain-containing protein